MKTQNASVSQTDWKISQDTLSGDRLLETEVGRQEGGREEKAPDTYVRSFPKLPKHLGGGVSLHADAKKSPTPTPRMDPTLPAFSEAAPVASTATPAELALKAPAAPAPAGTASPADELRKLYHLGKEVYRDFYDGVKRLDALVKEETGRSLVDHVADGFEALDKGIHKAVEVGSEIASEIGTGLKDFFVEEKTFKKGGSLK